MNITWQKLRQDINKSCPLAIIYTTDKTFVVESIVYVMDLLKKTDARQIEPRANQMQCEDISIYTWGMSKLLRYKEGIDNKDSKYDHSLALGLCFGSLFNGIPGPHYQLISLCEEGLYLIEPQKMLYWLPSRTDNVLWVTI